MITLNDCKAFCVSKARRLKARQPILAAPAAALSRRLAA